MDDTAGLQAIADEIARRAQQRGLRVAAAESLTSGAIASALGRGSDASEWFAGGVVAYSEQVKREVLGVTAASVLTPQCARELALGAVRLLGADVAVAVTGVGGPDPEEGLPSGTVYAATATTRVIATAAGAGAGAGDDRRDVVRDVEWHFDGDPAAVVEQTVAAALGLLRDALA